MSGLRYMLSFCSGNVCPYVGEDGFDADSPNGLKPPTTIVKRFVGNNKKGQEVWRKPTQLMISGDLYYI